MRIYFTDEQKKNNINIIDLEDDNVIIRGEYIEGEGKNYIINGTAIIDNEKYNNFEIEFELTNEVYDNDLEKILKSEWEWYDYIL